MFIGVMIEKSNSSKTPGLNNVEECVPGTLVCKQKVSSP